MMEIIKLFLPDRALPVLIVAGIFVFSLCCILGFLISTLGGA